MMKKRKRLIKEFNYGKIDMCYNTDIDIWFQEFMCMRCAKREEKS